jgi:Tfp pilus assembly protein PilZ
MLHDNREWLRLPITTRTFVEVESADASRSNTGRLLACSTVTVSRGGIRVAVDEPIAIGKILQVGIDSPQDNQILYLTGETIWCNPTDTELPAWHVGFKLLNNSDSDIQTWYKLLASLDS